MVNAIGGVIQPGMDLVGLVLPEDGFLFEVHVKPADMAALRPGHAAHVKITAYDFAIYGKSRAKPEHIGADTITDGSGEGFLLIRVRTERSNLGTDADLLGILPGMTVMVDFLTGENTVLD